MPQAYGGWHMLDTILIQWLWTKECKLEEIMTKKGIKLMVMSSDF